MRLAALAAPEMDYNHPEKVRRLPACNAWWSETGMFIPTACIVSGALVLSTKS